MIRNIIVLVCFLALIVLFAAFAVKNQQEKVALMHEIEISNAKVATSISNYVEQASELIAESKRLRAKLEARQ